MMEPPIVGTALLCSSWAGTDLWLYPELITLCIVHHATIGVLIPLSLGSVELSMGSHTIPMFGSYIIILFVFQDEYGLNSYKRSAAAYHSGAYKVTLYLDL